MSVLRSVKEERGVEIDYRSNQEMRPPAFIHHVSRETVWKVPTGTKPGLHRPT
jgi:hypothetical protein